MMFSFSKGVLGFIWGAHKEAKARNHQFVTPEHLMCVLLRKNSVRLFFAKCGIDYSMLEKETEEYLKTKVPRMSDENAGKEEETLFGFTGCDAFEDADFELSALEYGLNEGAAAVFGAGFAGEADLSMNGERRGAHGGAFTRYNERETFIRLAETVLKEELAEYATETHGDKAAADTEEAAARGNGEAACNKGETAEVHATPNNTEAAHKPEETRDNTAETTPANTAAADALQNSTGTLSGGAPVTRAPDTPSDTRHDFATADFLPQSYGFRSVLGRAAEQRICAEKKTVRIVDLILALFDEDSSFCAYGMRMAGARRVLLLETISESCDDEDKSGKGSVFSDTGDLIEYMNGIETFAASDGKEGGDIVFAFDGEFDGVDFDHMCSVDDEDDEDEDDERETQKYLERFTVDLTERARNGELDPLIGRHEELERTIQILCRRTKNNPIHVGESGVGKTALTEGLALRIVQGKVPEPLRDFSVLSLDITSLIAGTQYRGDLENRVRRIFDGLLKRGNVILFIDEIHTIMGAGAVEGEPAGVAAMLKPLFLSPTVRCIGATTHAEYARYFEKDAAMVRRFQKVVIEEPSEEDAILILKGLRTRYEEFHSVIYEDAALETAVKLAHRFISDRFLPDTAIDVIDEAGSFVRLHPNDFIVTKDEKPRITAALIEKVTAKIARIPEQTVSTGETERLRTLEKTLSAQIFGQQTAVHAVVQAVKRARAGFRNGEKPIASFLFVGPTGVGKTELSRALAAELGVALHRFDMSEYQEKHTISRLIGSPPGYVGFEEGALLINAVRKEPNAVVLLDEIEKAHSDIFNVLLQVMDYATLTDSHGRKADFRHVILIMTSNAGARDVNKKLIGFGGRTQDESALTEAVEKTFTPEFRNRLDAVVPFLHLSRETIENVTKKEAEKLAARLSEKGVTLVVKPSALALLADLGYSSDFGARNIARTIDEKIGSVLVDEILFGRLRNGGKATCNAKNGSIVITYAKPKKR